MAAGVNAFEQCGALVRPGFLFQGSEQHAQCVHGLAQVVAGGRQKAGFVTVGLLGSIALFAQGMGGFVHALLQTLA